MADKHLFAAPVSTEIMDLRARLRLMSNRGLRDFGTTTRRKLSQCELGDQQSVECAIQLEEAVLEWRRRQKMKSNVRTR